MKMLQMLGGEFIVSLVVRLKSVLSWMIGTIVIFCAFVRANGDSWEEKVRQTGEELRDKDRPQWVGAFNCLMGVDQRLYAYTSAKKSWMAIRFIGVFGVQETSFLNIREKGGALFLDGPERLVNYEPLSTAMVSAKYGPRIYLVPLGQIHGFCLNVLNGKKLDSYLHDSEVLHPTNNELIVDSKFEIFKNLPAFKIVLSDTSRVAGTDKERRVVFENKESYHLYPGMHLACQDNYLYEVKSVEGDWAEAVLNHTSVRDPMRIPVPTVLTTWR